MEYQFHFVQKNMIILQLIKKQSEKIYINLRIFYYCQIVNNFSMNYFISIIIFFYYMLKSKKTTYFSTNTCEAVTNVVKCYLRIQNYSGEEQATIHDYEILDDNTIMLKENLQKLSFKMYSFSYVFNTTVNHQLLVSSLGLIDDLFEGHNHMLFIHGGTLSELLVGSTDQNGLAIQLFSLLFNQVKQPYQIQSKLFINAFSTQQDKNSYIDLLIGQRYKHFSKKGLQYNFYEKELKSLRDFLIALKIVITRYNQCCCLDDPLVFKFTLEHFDEHKQQMISSMLTLVYTNENQKIFESLITKMESLCLHEKLKKIEDGGDITNFLEPLMKSSKITILCSVLNHEPTIKKYSNLMEFISKYQNKTNLNVLKISKIPVNYQTQFNNYLKEAISLCNTNKIAKKLNKTKLITKLQTLSKSYEIFAKQCMTKLSNYLQFLEKEHQITKQAYNKIQFSVSLEIKQNNIKHFHIAKIYKLSENYKMEDLTSLQMKLKVLKNQIQVAFKAQQKNYFSTENCDEQLMQYFQIMQAKLKIIKKFLKLIFSMSCKKLQEVSIKKININSLFQATQLKDIQKSLEKGYKTQNISLSIRKLTEQSRISKNPSLISYQTVVIRSTKTSKQPLKKTGSILPKITISRKGKQNI